MFAAGAFPSGVRQHSVTDSICRATPHDALPAFAVVYTEFHSVYALACAGGWMFTLLLNGPNVTCVRSEMDCFVK